MVNLGYHAFAWEALPRTEHGHDTSRIRQRALARSYVSIGLFATAMLLSLKLPWLGFALVTLVLLSYIRPELPGRHKTTADDRSVR
jgi:hypothetical protein